MTYQILYKGIYSNHLGLFESNSFKDFKSNIEAFQKGKYKNLQLIMTNIADV